MKPLKYDEVRRILPAVEELQPVFDLLLAQSYPDPEQQWAGSGELSTEGARLVDADAVARHADELAARVHERLVALYTSIGDAVQRLAQGDRVGSAVALLEASALEETNGRHERAQKYAVAAYRAAREAGDWVVASRGLRRCARAAKAQGELREARIRYEEGFRISLANLDLRGAAEAALGVGNVIEQHGGWTEAQTWYERALEVLDGYEGPAPERWQAKVNVHIVLRSSGALDESRPWLTAAETEAAAVDDSGARVFFENAWGQLHLWSGEFAEAERRFRAGIEATERPHARVTIRLNLAEALLAQGRLLDASEEGREAEREALASAAWPKLPEVYRVLGRVAAGSGNPDAFVLFERSLAISRERDLPILEQAMTLQAYAEAERDRGETDTAEQLLDEARRLYKTVGIDDLRHRWTDVYGAERSSTVTDSESQTDNE